jgi:hypothetical protein
MLRGPCTQWPAASGLRVVPKSETPLKAGGLTLRSATALCGGGVEQCSHRRARPADDDRDLYGGAYLRSLTSVISP